MQILSTLSHSHWAWAAQRWVALQLGTAQLASDNQSPAAVAASKAGTAA